MSDPFDYNFAPAPCLPCCSVTPPTLPCDCTLPIPQHGDPGIDIYASFADAQAAIAATVYSCRLYNDPNLAPWGPAFYSTFEFVEGSPNQINIVSPPAADGPSSADAWMSVSLLAGSTLTIGWDITNNGSGTGFTPETSFRIAIIRCDGTSEGANYSTGPVLSDNITGSFDFVVPSDGIYYVELQPVWTNDEGTDVLFSGDAALTISSDQPMAVNPVMSWWDDSGTTRKFPACPRLALPPNFEFTNLWYADEATAAAVLASELVSNCIGYIADSFEGQTINAFTATTDGSSVDLHGEATRDTGGDSAPTVSMWCSMVIEGTNLKVDWSVSTDGTIVPGSGFSALIQVLDITGNTVVFDSASWPTASGTFNLTVPCPGTYKIIVGLVGKYIVAPPFHASVTGDATVYSDDTVIVNPVRAYFDVGANCGDWLECGE